MFAFRSSSFAFLRAKVCVKAMVVRSLIRRNNSSCPLPRFWGIAAQVFGYRLSLKEVLTGKKVTYMDAEDVSEAN